MADAHAAELAALKAGAARAAASSADELRACHVALSEARAECGRLAGDLRAAQSRVEALEGTRSASAKELRDVRDELARTKEEIVRLRVAGDAAVAEAKRDAEAHVRNEVPVTCASHCCCSSQEMPTRCECVCGFLQLLQRDERHRREVDVRRRAWAGTCVAFTKSRSLTHALVTRLTAHDDRVAGQVEDCRV